MTYRNGAILCISAAAIWSLMGLLIRQISVADTWQVLLWRSIGAASVLGLWVALQSGGRPWERIRATGRAGAIGGLALVAAFAGAIYAIQTTTVANAVFLFSASPFLAAILGWLTLREPVRPATWAAMAVAGFGMFVMVRNDLGAGAMAGNLAALCSAFGFATFTVALRQANLKDTMPVSLLGCVFSAAIAALVLGMSGNGLLPPLADVAVSLAMGVVVLAAGMILYTLGSRALPATEATLMSLAEVLLAPLWVWWFLGETVSPATLTGGGIVLVAVAMNAVAGNRPRAIV